MGVFTEKVRHGEIIGPRKRTFTEAGWKQAYEEFSSGDEADTALYISGKHIHTKLAAIRKVISESSLSCLSTETRIKALVSFANHQYEALELQMSKLAANVANAGGEFHVRDVATSQVKLADGVSYNADAALGSILDGIAIPTKVALNGQPQVREDGFGDVNWNDVCLEINLGALYDQTENLWEDCVWNTYILHGTNKHLLAFPMDINAKRGTHAAAARRVALSIESTSYAIRAFEQAGGHGFISRIKEVQAVVTRGNQQHIVVAANKLDTNSQSMLFALRTMACPQYYDSILKEQQPLLAGATLSELFDAWMVVSEAAKCLWKATSPARRSELPTDPNAVSNMCEYVPFFTTEALVAAVHEAAEIPISKAQTIIKFLTFQGKDKQEFWTQPLVSTGDRSKLYPVFGAVAAPPNLRFALERWMAQLKVRLDKRGTPFEDYLRASLVKAARTSPILSQVAKVVPHDYTFTCVDKSFGQIDALFCIGSQVFAVEAKCILEPTESTSIGTHRVTIEGAVKQAKTRVALIEGHREEFIAEMKKFGWRLPSEFRVNPLVAVSTVAHVGVPCDGVPVVDELVLGKFFAGGYEDAGLDTDDFSVIHRTFHPFYANASEAEASATLYFEKPPQLQQYSELLQLRKVPMYAVSENDWGGVMIDFEQCSRVTAA